MRLYIIFLILLSIIAKGQDTIQKSYSFQNKPHWFNNFFIKNFDRMEYWPQTFTGNFTTSSLYLKNYDKDLYLGQEAKSYTQFGVNTHGKWQNPKRKIAYAGNINIYKEYQNKKAWNNSPFEVSENGIMPDPHYYLVKRAGNWRNIYYKISGAMQIPVFKNFKVQTAVKYNLEEKYRANLDPRTEASGNSLEGKLGVNYTYKNNQFGVAVNTGYTDKFTNHTRVIREQDTPYYYEKYLKWMWGYGQFFNIKKDNSRREGAKNMLSSSYTFKNKNNLISLNLNFIDIKIDNFDSSSKSNPNDPEDNHFGVTETTKYKLNFYSQHKYKKDHQLYILFNGSREKTNNYLDDLKGISYKNELNNYKLQVSNLYQNHHLMNEYGIEFQYKTYKQNDLFSEIATEGEVLNLGFFYEKDMAIKKFVIAPYFKLNYLFRTNNLNIRKEPDFTNISANDFLELTRRDFFNEVIYNDHDILNNDIISLQFKPEIKTPINKKYQFIIATGFEYHYLLQQKKGNKYFNASLSINY